PSASVRASANAASTVTVPPAATPSAAPMDTRCACCATRCVSVVGAWLDMSMTLACLPTCCKYRPMAEQASAFWITAPNRGEIRAEALPSPSPDQALVRTLYSGISRGTETLVFGGRVPPSEHTRMRAPFQTGEFPAPVKYGYCNVGVVEQGPATLR